MTKGVDPSLIGKHPQIIKKAQMEMGDTDVLVCGRCYATFHFVPEFNEHKTAPCLKVKKSTSIGNSENPKIWAFILWKSAQPTVDDDDDDALTANDADRSWPTYRKWLKLDETVRETWVVASRTIQSFAKIASGILEEMPVKITKTVVDLPKTSPVVATPSMVKATLTPKPVVVPAAKATFPLVAKPAVTSVKKPVVIAETVAASPSPVTKVSVAISENTSRWARRTIPSSDGQTEDLNVEKILAKRFNPRIKQHEYLIKWDKRSTDENGWEPKSHLETCPDLLVMFENQLARQKEIRAKAEAAAKAKADGVVTTPVSTKKRKATDDECDNEDEVTGTKLIKSTTGTPAAANNGPAAKPTMMVKNNGGSPTTGIVKKQGNLAGGSANNVQKGQAQVKFVPKVVGGASGLSGVVRVNAAGQQVMVAETNKAVTAVNGPVPKQVGSATGIKTGIKTGPIGAKPIAKPGGITPGKIAPTGQRTVGQPPIPVITKVPPKAAAIGKPTLTSTAPKSKTEVAAQAQIHDALQRQGSLKVNRAQTSPAPQSKVTQKTISNSPKSISIDGTIVSAADAVNDDSAEEVFDLCPITGKNLASKNDITTPQKTTISRPTTAVPPKAPAVVQQQQPQILTDQKLQQFNEDGSPVLVRGDDGTIYRVGGFNEHGQTILIPQLEAMAVMDKKSPTKMMVASGEMITAGTSQPLTIATEDDAGNEAQITAEVVQADLPSPGGTRKVVLLLPDGNLMMTEVSDEQYQSLNLST